MSVPCPLSIQSTPKSAKTWPVTRPGRGPRQRPVCTLLWPVQFPQPGMLFPLPRVSGKFSVESQLTHSCLLPATVLGCALRACAL